MYAASTNHPREDSIFGLKVKSAMRACDGSFVAALDDFEARHQAAISKGAKGLSYSEFLSYLQDHGVSDLSEFDARYLCNSFDDGVPPKKNDVISAATFTRHLTGLNHRRMKAVLQAWQVVLESTGREDSEPDQRATVPADELMATHRAAAAAAHTAASRAATWSSSSGGAKLEAAFLGSGNGAGSTRGPAMFAAASERKTAGTGAGDSGAPPVAADVTRSGFVAFYASLSPEYCSDEAFEVMVLKEWGADRPQRPKLQETQRVWGEEGDPLAISDTHYVHDALKRDLGVSSKSYNYTHMAREQPYVEPLAPLDRVDLMESTTQRHFKPYDANAQTFADPLATRRGQMM